ncbi:MAG: hypothetical protein IT463_08810 [Planctomycetes bacterium]|nr:hypothetical protein [Planctomycetota bacterium]
MRKLLSLLCLALSALVGCQKSPDPPRLNLDPPAPRSNHALAPAETPPAPAGYKLVVTDASTGLPVPAYCRTSALDEPAFLWRALGAAACGNANGEVLLIPPDTAAPLNLTVDYPGYFRWHSMPFTQDAYESALPKTIALEPTRNVQLAFTVDDDGTGTIWLERVWPPPELFQRPLMVSAYPKGPVRIPDGIWLASRIAEGGRKRVCAFEVTAATTRVELDLTATGNCRVSLKLAPGTARANGTLPDDFDCVLERRLPLGRWAVEGSCWLGRHSAPEDQQINGVDSGAYRLRCTRHDRKLMDPIPLVLAEGRRDVQIELPPFDQSTKSHLRMRVLRSGKPAPGVRVWGSNGSLSGGTVPDLEHVAALTDRNGEVELSAWFSFSCWGTSWDQYSNQPDMDGPLAFRLKPGEQPADLDLEVPARQNVVLDSFRVTVNGQLAEGSLSYPTIRLAATDGTHWYLRYVENGLHQLDGLPHGTYLLQGTSEEDGYCACWWREVRLDSSGDLRVTPEGDLRMVALGSARVSAAEHCRLQVRTGNGYWHTLTETRPGMALALPPGTYRILASHDYSARVVEEFELAADGTKTSIPVRPSEPLPEMRGAVPPATQTLRLMPQDPLPVAVRLSDARAVFKEWPKVGCDFWSPRKVWFQTVRGEGRSEHIPLLLPGDPVWAMQEVSRDPRAPWGDDPASVQILTRQLSMSVGGVFVPLALPPQSLHDIENAEVLDADGNRLKFHFAASKGRRGVLVWPLQPGHAQMNIKVGREDRIATADVRAGEVIALE